MNRRLPKGPPRTIQLSVRIPHGTTDEETAEYCIHAINSWGGGLHPEDDFFDGCTTLSARSSTNRFALRKDEYGNVQIVRRISKRRLK